MLGPILTKTSSHSAWGGVGFAAFLALFGFATLGAMMLTTPSTTTLRAAAAQGIPPQIGVVLPPWSQGGLAQAAGLGAPIIDLRWGGYLAILDIRARPGLGKTLRANGYFIIQTALSSTFFTKENPRA